MNLDFQQADELIANIVKELNQHHRKDVDVVICPPFPYLMIADYEAETNGYFLGAQNVSIFNNGAYTGEISASMLSAMCVDYCIVGHSERRKLFFESNKDVAEKVNRLLENDVKPIVCVGEVLEERENGQHFSVIKKQVSEGLFHLTEGQMQQIVIAYEPVWAIGTGRTASTFQAQEIHSFIRGLVLEKYGAETANEIRILYGGSCTAKNAKDLFAMPDVDGGLIGGASLKANDFVTIAQSF